MITSGGDSLLPADVSEPNSPQGVMHGIEETTVPDNHVQVYQVQLHIERYVQIYEICST